MRCTHAVAAGLAASLGSLALASEPPRPAPLVEVTVRDVVPTPEGHAVLLVPKAGAPVLPIFVGPCEANAIRMRLAKETAPRPLTHELLENMVRALGGKLVKVEIDDLRSATFLGRLHVEQAGKVIQIDARPSDSIALALGAGAPIYVARKVLDSAGIKPPGAKSEAL